MAFAWIYRVQMGSYSDSPQFFQWLGEVAGRWTPIFLLAEPGRPSLVRSLLGPFQLVYSRDMQFEKYGIGVLAGDNSVTEPRSTSSTRRIYKFAQPLKRSTPDLAQPLKRTPDLKGTPLLLVCSRVCYLYIEYDSLEEFLKPGVVTTVAVSNITFSELMVYKVRLH